MLERTAEKEARLAKAVKLRDLLGSEGWDTYYREVEALQAQRIESILTGKKDDFEYEKGRLQGLRDAVNMPREHVAREFNRS